MGRGNRGPCSFAMRVAWNARRLRYGYPTTDSLEILRMFILWVHDADPSISIRVILPILQEDEMT